MMCSDMVALPNTIDYTDGCQGWLPGLFGKAFQHHQKTLLWGRTESVLATHKLECPVRRHKGVFVSKFVTAFYSNEYSVDRHLVRTLRSLMDELHTQILNMESTEG